jgi:hypothetical protein
MVDVIFLTSFRRLLNQLMGGMPWLQSWTLYAVDSALSLFSAIAAVFRLAPITPTNNAQANNASEAITPWPELDVENGLLLVLLLMLLVMVEAFRMRRRPRRAQIRR